MSTIHARGLGQVNPVCKGGHIGTLGPVKSWEDVTCAACKLRPIIDAATAAWKVVKDFAAAFEDAARALGFVARPAPTLTIPPVPPLDLSRVAVPNLTTGATP